MDTVENFFPPRQRARARQVREVAFFSEQNLREFYLSHLMVLYPNQPDMLLDYPLWWDRRVQHEYRVFQDITIDGKYLECFGSSCEQWFIHQYKWFPNSK